MSDPAKRDAWTFTNRPTECNNAAHTYEDSQREWQQWANRLAALESGSSQANLQPPGNAGSGAANVPDEEPSP